MHIMWQEVSKLSSLGSKNPRTFVIATFKVGMIKFQGFRVSVTSYFHHFVAPNVKRGLKIAFTQNKKSSNFCYWNFKSWYNKISRTLRFSHLLFSSFYCPLCEKMFENCILSNKKNPRTFVTETFNVGIIKFQGFGVSVTSYFHHFVAPYVKRGLKIAFSQIQKSLNFCYWNF